MGWVFQGNPNRFDIDDYLSRYPVLIYWRTPRYAGEITVGDRAFIWRSGSEAGAIAIGRVVEAPVPLGRVKHPDALGNDLWITEMPDPQEPRTGLQVESLRLTLAQDMISRDVVKGHPVLGETSLIRMPNASVFKLSEDETKEMEGLWGAAASAASTSSGQEGEKRLRSHYVRERSPRLRDDKVKQFREVHGQLHCELCMEGEDAKYPRDYSERVFEVHHLAPLAAVSMPVRTTLNDLAVLCANCHRAVHATKHVDENFKLLFTYFEHSRRRVQ